MSHLKRLAREGGVVSRKILVVWVAMAVSCSCLALAVECDALFAQADSLYDTQNGTFDLVAYEGRLRESIGLYEQGLALLSQTALQTRSATLNRLARAYFELANAYIPTGPDQEAAYVAGKDHALMSLRLDPAFVALEAASFRDALSNANDIEAVFWYGTNFGCYLGYHRSLTSFENLALMASGPADIRACYERAIALDETYLAAAPLRSLACFLAQVPSLIGGDMVRARDVFARAMAIAPEFLQNAVDLSEWVLKPTGETDAFCSTLHDVVARAADSAVMGAWPLYNELALRRAVTMSSGCP
jgi:tetratricopeptide (TPR) repeat protein